MKTLLIASTAVIAAGYLVVGAPVQAQLLSPPSCETVAKENIDWVIYQNLNYRSTLETAIRNGAAPYDALLMTERYNPIGEAAFRACPDWTKNYLQMLNLGAPVGPKPTRG